MADGRDCTRCKTWKAADKFKANPKASTGLDCWCRDCRAEDARERYAANPEKFRASSRKWHHANPEKASASRRRQNLKRLYGMTVDEFDAMLTGQDSRCAICQSGSPKGVNWHVDHDHLTGRVRAILCHPCNVTLGNVNDDPETLLSMAAYLLSFQDVLAAADLLKSSRVHRDVDLTSDED